MVKIWRYALFLHHIRQCIQHVALLLFHTRGDVLERICKAEFPQTRIDHLARSNWSPERGLTAVRHYSARSVAAVLGTDVQAKYLCLSALSALVFFFEEVHQLFREVRWLLQRGATAPSKAKE